MLEDSWPVVRDFLVLRILSVPAATRPCIAAWNVLFEYKHFTHTGHQFVSLAHPDPRKQANFKLQTSPR